MIRIMGIICFVFLYLFSLSISGQISDSISVLQKSDKLLALHTQDTLKKVDRADGNIDNLSSKDTVAWVNKRLDVDKPTQNILSNKQLFKPDPTKAVLYSAVFPGLGQIYNKKYWKLPIVYGGLVGFVYAITWNNRMYKDYTMAYSAIMSDDYLEKKDDYIYIFPSTTNPAGWTTTQLQNFREQIRRRRDYNRRNRDLSIIGAIAMYALCMIDAYVDAQLYDFDVSPNLSFKVEPKIGVDAFSQKSFGLQCSITF